MTAEECADILRKTISHREKMHNEPQIWVGPDGERRMGTINADADILYHAMKFALPCVEEKIGK
ncbi:MAG: hypothetical protein E7461_08035 [Ruminococcaceae bacterium]|nr:hypothetical protein [Oscillospiraceae bacterium]